MGSRCSLLMPGVTLPPRPCCPPSCLTLLSSIRHVVSPPLSKTTHCQKKLALPKFSKSTLTIVIITIYCELKCEWLTIEESFDKSLFFIWSFVSFKKACIGEENWDIIIRCKSCSIRKHPTNNNNDKWGGLSWDLSCQSGKQTSS